MLQLNAISKSFNGKCALDRVHLRVATGETHVLLGSSGSGKTTLLRAVMGLLSLDSGEIVLEGKRLGECPPHDWVRRIGYVPQDGGLFPHMTARQNVNLLASTLNWTSARMMERTEELRKIVALDADLLSRFPKELSGGQRQRVALMRAVFLDPALLLLDEPLGAMDPILRFEVQTELREIFQRLKKTVLLVTHDISEAAYLADEVTLLHEGTVVQAGKLADLVHHPAKPFVTQFINAQRPRGLE